MKRIMIAALLLSATSAYARDFEDGLRHKQAEQFEEAAASFARVVEREPRNAAALEQLATLQGWLQRYETSIAHWRRAIAIDGDNPDYRVGLARILWWKGEPEAALESLNGALRLAPEHADALELKQKLTQQIAQGAGGGLRWRLDAGHNIDRYDAGRGNESSSFAQIGYARSPQTTFYARAERWFSFESVDGGAVAGGYFLLSPTTLVNAEVGITPGEADFRSDRQFTATGEFLLNKKLQPLLGLRLLSYERGDVTTITPGVRWLLPWAALELRYGYSNNTDDSDTGVVQARLSREAGIYVPYIAYADGEEALPPLAKAEISILGAGCVINLNPRWGLRVDASREDRKDTYIHTAYGAGVTYRY